MAITETRKKHLGSSHIPAVLDESPYSTPYDLWLFRLMESYRMEDEHASD